METVLIVIHLMIVVALAVVVLLQRSEGGALGMGGGGGGFMTGRGQANALTRATAILGTLFFITSLALTVLANMGRAPSSPLDGVSPQAPAGQSQPGAPAGGSLFDQLQRQEQSRPAAPEPPRQ
jgi:preprotein translocase subunit SecG